MRIKNLKGATGVFCAVVAAASTANADGATNTSASSLIHETQSIRTIEKGVAVYRGATPQQEPALAGGDALPILIKKVTIVERDRYPPRRMRRQGFWSGTGPSSKHFTQGFFADRVHAIGARAQR